MKHMGRPIKTLPKIDQLRYELMNAICLQNRQDQSLLNVLPARRIHKRHNAKQCPHAKEELEDLYINKGMTRRQIADHYGVGMGNVNGWFSGLGIRLPQEMYQKVVRGQCRSVVNNAKQAQMAQQRHLAHKNTHLMDGYVKLYNTGHPSCTKDGYIAEHRHLIEATIKRFLTDEEHVHHINYNRTDNRLANLMLLTAVDHGRIHKFMEYYGAYALGASLGKPEPLVFLSPAFWDGEWYNSLSAEDFLEINKQKNKVKGN